VLAQTGGSLARGLIASGHRIKLIDLMIVHNLLGG